MKKLFKLTALASAVFLLGACADETVLNPEQAREAAPESNAIQFGTYMGKAGTTRAGYVGNIKSAEMLGNPALANGFGVFAYYTGKNNFGEATRPEPNFMYNQHVYLDAANATAPSITSWYYTPIKYWPNEVTNVTGKGVDDQDKDKDQDPATTSYNFGGNVSFFAYAPYITVTQKTPGSSTGAWASDYTGNKDDIGTSGILSLSHNDYTCDPYVGYKIPKSGETVDLLWGTKGNTNVNVNDDGNAGVQGDGSNTDYSMGWTGTTTDYQKYILDKYTLNADLTKQKTTGKIEFLFKHALGKVGGSYDKGDGSDDDASTPTNGLMVVLDIDNDGAETGGLLEDWTESATTDKLKYKTKVTVKNVKIMSYMQANTKPTVNSDGSITLTTEPLQNYGLFDLATGQWTSRATTTDFIPTGGTHPEEGDGINHIIVSPGSSTTDKDKQSAVLATEIAEPAATALANKTEHQNFFKTTLPIGVTTVPKNVYEDEANPLVFIPGTYPIIYFEIDYIVRTYDDNLKNGYSEVEQVIKKRLVFLDKVELNKQYNVLMHLGLTGVKFTATVSDWDSTELTTTTTTDPNTGDVVRIYTSDEDIYLPINVEGTVTAMNVTNTIPAKVTSSGGDAGKFTVNVDYVTKEGKSYPNLDVTNEASYTPDVSWIHVDSKGNVTLDEYKAIGAGDRTGNVTITYADRTETVAITQAGRYVYSLALAVNSNSTNFNATAAQQDWNYTMSALIVDGQGYNQYVDPIATNDAYAIGITGVSGWKINKANHKISVPANTTSDEKVGTITATYYGKSASITATQARAVLNAMSATTSPSTLTFGRVVNADTPVKDEVTTTTNKVVFPAAGGTLTFKSLTANFGGDTPAVTETHTSGVTFSIASATSWLHINGNQIKIDPNMTSDTDEDSNDVTVTFKDKGGNTQTLTFKVTRSKLTSVALTLTVNDGISGNKDFTANGTFETSYLSKQISAKLKAKFSDGTAANDFTKDITSTTTVKLQDTPAYTTANGSGVFTVATNNSASIREMDKIETSYTVGSLSITKPVVTIKQKANPSM